MKKVFGIVAVVATSLAFVACNQNKTTDEQTDSTVIETEEVAPVALADVDLVGVWTAQLPSADTNKPIVSTITFKEGKVYDLVTEKPEAKLPEELKDQAYTIEGNFVALADGLKLEFADGKLFILNKEGVRSTTTMEGEHGLYVYNKVDVAAAAEKAKDAPKKDAPKKETPKA